MAGCKLLKLFKQFKNGLTSAKDAEHSGCPSKSRKDGNVLVSVNPGRQLFHPPRFVRSTGAILQNFPTHFIG
jgi:hypothetical protein